MITTADREISQSLKPFFTTELKIAIAVALGILAIIATACYLGEGDLKLGFHQIGSGFEFIAKSLVNHWETTVFIVSMMGIVFFGSKLGYRQYRKYNPNQEASIHLPTKPKPPLKRPSIPVVLPVSPTTSSHSSSLNSSEDLLHVSNVIREIEIGRGKHRIAILLEDANGKKVVTKNANYIAQTCNDCFAYSISLQLNLPVVPALKLEDETIYQQYIKPAEPGVQINIPSAQQAIILQLILERSDPTRSNSVVDQNGNIWEIDNERIFGLLGKPWLLDPSNNPDAAKLENFPLSQELLHQISLQAPISLNTLLFRNTNYLEEAERLAPVLTKKVNNNICLLQKTITKLGGPTTVITLGQLTAEYFLQRNQRG